MATSGEVSLKYRFFLLCSGLLISCGYCSESTSIVYRSGGKRASRLCGAVDTAASVQLSCPKSTWFYVIQKLSSEHNLDSRNCSAEKYPNATQVLASSAHTPALNTECRGLSSTNSDSGDQLCNETVQVPNLLDPSRVQFFEAAYECLSDSKMFNMCDNLTKTISSTSSPAGDMYLASPSLFSSPQTPNTTCTCSMTTSERFSAKALYLSLSNSSDDWNITCEKCGFNFQYNNNPTVNEVLFQSKGQNTTYTLQIDFHPSRGLGADDNELWISFKGGSSIQLACNVPLVTTTPGPATTESSQGTITSGTPNITNTASSGDTTLVPGRNDTLSTTVTPEISTDSSTQLTDSGSTTVVLGTTVTTETSTTSSAVTASPTGVTTTPRTTTTTAAVSREAITNTTLTATSTKVSTFPSTTNSASVEQNATSTSSITVSTEATSIITDNSTTVEVTTPAPPVATDTQGTTGTTITTPPSSTSSANTSTPPTTTTTTPTTPTAAVTTATTTTSKTSLVTTEGSPDKSTTQEMLTSSPNNTTSQEMQTTRSVYTQSSSSTTTEEGAAVTSPAVPGEETSTSVVDAAPSKTSGLDDMYIYIIIAVVVVVLLILVITVILAVRRRRRMMADPNTDRKQFFVPGGDSESGITGRRISSHLSEIDLTDNNNDETTVSPYAKGESSSRGQGKHAGKTFPHDGESSSGQPEKLAMTTFGKPVKSSLKKNNGNGQEVTATQGQPESQELSTDGVDGGQQVAHAGNPPGDHTYFILEPQPEVKKKRGVLFLTDKKGRDLLRDKDGNIIGFDDDDSDDVNYDIKPSKSTATHHVNEFPRRPSNHVYSEVDDDVVKENEENNDAGSSGPVAANHADVTPGRLSFHEYYEIELPAATYSEAMKGKKTPSPSQPRTSLSMSDGAYEDVDFKPDRDKDDFMIDNVAYESTDSLGPKSAQQKSAGHVDDDTIMIDNVAYESTDSLGLNSHAGQTEQKDAGRGDGDDFMIDNVAYESADSLSVKPNASSRHTDEHDSIVPAQSAVGGADSQQAEASVDEDGDSYVKIKDIHEAKRAAGLRASVPDGHKGDSSEDNKSDSIKTVHHNDHKLIDNADENQTSDELLHESSSDLDTDDTVGRKPGGKAHISKISIQRDQAKETVDSTGGEDVSSDDKASSSRVHVEATRTSSV